MRSFSILRASSLLPLFVVAACGNGGSTTASGGATSATGVTTSTGSPTTATGATTSGTSGTASTSATGTTTSGTASTSATSSTGTGGGNTPAGWLYTKGAGIFVADGMGGGTPWMGRGVNVDDIYLCGYNNTLQSNDQGAALKTLMANLIASWKPSFVRISLGMASYPTQSSWLTSPNQYKTPMTDVINTLANSAYVLVTLRSDASMILQDTADGDAEATGLPSDSTTTPDATKFPKGTDATYIALVDTFAHSPHILFGLTNEPGGNKRTNDQIKKAMDHAVSVIRAEEDAQGVPHHIVSVQGNGWTSDISFYASAPLTEPNVVYEVHGYPPATSSYTYSNIPVIIGEYGSLPDATSFYADVEAKQIPNLAWDFESYSNCAPDLLNVNDSSTNIQPSAWGDTVKAYLAAH